MESVTYNTEFVKSKEKGSIETTYQGINAKSGDFKEDVAIIEGAEKPSFRDMLAKNLPQEDQRPANPILEFPPAAEGTHLKDESWPDLAAKDRALDIVEPTARQVSVSNSEVTKNMESERIQREKELFFKPHEERTFLEKSKDRISDVASSLKEKVQSWETKKADDSWPDLSAPDRVQDTENEQIRREKELFFKPHENRTFLEKSKDAITDVTSSVKEKAHHLKENVTETTGKIFGGHQEEEKKFTYPGQPISFVSQGEKITEDKTNYIDERKFWQCKESTTSGTVGLDKPPISAAVDEKSVPVLEFPFQAGRPQYSELVIKREEMGTTNNTTSYPGQPITFVPQGEKITEDKTNYIDEGRFVEGQPVPISEPQLHIVDTTTGDIDDAHEGHHKKSKGVFGKIKEVFHNIAHACDVKPSEVAAEVEVGRRFHEVHDPEAAMKARTSHVKEFYPTHAWNPTPTATGPEEGNSQWKAEGAYKEVEGGFKDPKHKAGSPTFAPPMLPRDNY
jgi:hypothetical protein